MNEKRLEEIINKRKERVKYVKSEKDYYTHWYVDAAEQIIQDLSSLRENKEVDIYECTVCHNRWQTEYLADECCR